MRRHLALIIAALAFFADVCATECMAGPGKTVPAWPQWRGPRQDGHSDDASVPLVWNRDKNLKWQTDLPGFGHSSPVVWGDRVFLTSATKTGSERWLMCLDRSDGKILWQRTAAQALPAESVHAWNTHASATCVTDGERVYAFFGNPGVFCYDFRGNLLWKKDFGPLITATGWGAGAASPMLFEDMVIINGDHGAYRGQKDDKGTGTPVNIMPAKINPQMSQIPQIQKLFMGPVSCETGPR